MIISADLNLEQRRSRDSIVLLARVFIQESRTLSSSSLLSHSYPVTSLSSKVIVHKARAMHHELFVSSMLHTLDAGRYSGEGDREGEFEARPCLMR